MATVPVGSVRDHTPNRAIQRGGYQVGSCSIQTEPDGAVTGWTPRPGACHVFATVAGARALVITDATTKLPYDLAVGEGFQFSVQNNGANTITISGAGNVSAGAGTLTIATTTTRLFILSRTGASTYRIDTLGVLSQ